MVAIINLWVGRGLATERQNVKYRPKQSNPGHYLRGPYIAPALGADYFGLYFLQVKGEKMKKYKTQWTEYHEGSVLILTPDKTIIKNESQPSFGISINWNDPKRILKPFFIIDFWHIHINIGFLADIPDDYCVGIDFSKPGSDFSIKHCSNCNSEFRSIEEYCPSCGAQIVW